MLGGTNTEKESGMFLLIIFTSWFDEGRTHIGKVSFVARAGVRELGFEARARNCEYKGLESNHMNDGSHPR